MIRTAWALLVALVATVVCTSGVFAAALFRVRDREGGVYDHMQRLWARAILWGSGVRVVVHGAEHTRTGRPIVVGNHVSWFDVLAVAAVLPRARFVAKQEVRRIPLVGPAAAAAGHVYIVRENRKAAFEQYKDAAARIHDGARVIVFAEGTRGREYALRPFKKGPFVLAVSAGAPIVPLVVHGTIPIMPKGSFRIHSGTAHLHFLPPIPTTGLGYDDRDRLAVMTRDAIAQALQQEYGVTSPPWDPRAARPASA